MSLTDQVGDIEKDVAKAKRKIDELYERLEYWQEKNANIPGGDPQARRQIDAIEVQIAAEEKRQRGRSDNVKGLKEEIAAEEKATKVIEEQNKAVNEWSKTWLKVRGILEGTNKIEVPQFSNWSTPRFDEMIAEQKDKAEKELKNWEIGGVFGDYGERMKEVEAEFNTIAKAAESATQRISDYAARTGQDFQTLMKEGMKPFQKQLEDIIQKLEKESPVLALFARDLLKSLTSQSGGLGAVLKPVTDSSVIWARRWTISSAASRTRWTISGHP